MNDKCTFFKWIIPKFSSYMEQRDKTGFKSKRFVISKDKNTAGRLRLEIGGISEFFIEIEKILNLKETEIPAYLDIMYSVFNASNQKVLFTRNQKAIILNKSYSSTNSSNFESMNTTYFRNKLVEGNLILLFKIRAHYTLNEKETRKLDENLELPKEEAQVETSFIDKKYCDVTIHIGERIVHALKGVLAFRSPYFNTMFTINMRESATSEVQINNFDYDVFIELLRFMYTGKIENFDQLVLQLLEAACFYQMDDLKVICENRLMSNINFENVCRTLIVADKCERQQLKYYCLSFINQHYAHVRNLSGFNDLLVDPNLSRDLLEILEIP